MDVDTIGMECDRAMSVVVHWQGRTSARCDIYLI